jgi:uncharacterized protein (UPF0261 family)
VADDGARVAILLLGTADTKADELRFLAAEIGQAGHTALVMDVGLLGEPPFAPDIDRDQVAAASGASRAEIIALGDENLAMQRMAAGAARLAASLHAAGRIQGALAIGGTMATDLALEVMAALPSGLPKVILSTIAFSPLIPPERIAPDLIMMLWAGGLWGLNTLSRSALRQAAGAVMGAAMASRGTMRWERPAVGVSSLGASTCRYLAFLKPWLEQRGYEVVVFHATGMGGRALEALAAEGRLVALLDLCLVELGNQALGSIVSAGSHRLESAGRRGIPQIVAPAGLDLTDLPAWQPLAPHHGGRTHHAHNRLIASVATTAEEKALIGRMIAEKLNAARGPAAFVMPMGGIDEWDRPGSLLHDVAGLAALAGAVRETLRPELPFIALEAHINDRAFAETVIGLFDRWVAEGLIARAG